MTNPTDTNEYRNDTDGEYPSVTPSEESRCPNCGDRLDAEGNHMGDDIPQVIDINKLFGKIFGQPTMDSDAPTLNKEDVFVLRAVLQFVGLTVTSVQAKVIGEMDIAQISARAAAASLRNIVPGASMKELNNALINLSMKLHGVETLHAPVF